MDRDHLPVNLLTIGHRHVLLIHDNLYSPRPDTAIERGHLPVVYCLCRHGLHAPCRRGVTNPHRTIERKHHGHLQNPHQRPLVYPDRRRATQSQGGQMKTPLDDLRLGDVITLDGLTTGTPYHHATIINIESNGRITCFRPYVHTSDFTYTQGLIPYIGTETYHLYIGGAPVNRIAKGGTYR